MKLYFLRHAQAEDRAIDDHHRRLTEQGKRRTRTAAKVLQQLGIRPVYIYSSPRLRAMETAEIVAGELKMNVTVHEAVNFSFNLQAVSDLIADLKPTDEVLFVGHEPSMSIVVSGLTGAIAEMKKGSLARVDLFDDVSLQSRLIWLIAPKVFDVLGQG